MFTTRFVAMRWFLLALAVGGLLAAFVLSPRASRRIEFDDLSGRVVVLTGATAGVGRHAASLLAARNATLVLGCRDVAKGHAIARTLRCSDGSLAFVEVMYYDAANLSSVRAFARDVRSKFLTGISVLINNAAVGGGSGREYSSTVDGFEEVVQQNYLAPALLTLELIPSLLFSAPSRVLFTTSQLHKFGTIDFETLGDSAKEAATARAQRCVALYPYLFLADHLVPGCRYASSKLLLTTLALRLGRRSDPERLAPVASIALHPASAPTDVVARYTHLPLVALRPALCNLFGLCYDQEVGLLTSHLASHPDLQRGAGLYYHSDSTPYVNCSKAAEACAEDEPSQIARDHVVQDRLLAQTCHLLGWEAGSCEALFDRASGNAGP